MKNQSLSKETREKILAKMLSVIKKKPGIRPSELNRLLNRAHSTSLRNSLIKGGLVRRERDGAAVRYYPI